MQQKIEYFTRFPNGYIQGNIKTKYGVSRKFYITYILRDKYRSYEDYSWITVRKVMEFYGYKTTKHKPKAFHEILDVLEYMVNNNMIEVKRNKQGVVEITIKGEALDVTEELFNVTINIIEALVKNGDLPKEQVIDFIDGFAQQVKDNIQIEEDK